MHPNQEKTRSQTLLERGVALAVIAFIGLLCLFPLRNNDVWWHLAVGKALVGSGHFITRDPFTFTVPGAPWVPHAWLSSILFYAVHAASGALGLLVLRAAVVVTMFVVVLGIVRRLGVSWVLAAPVVLLAVLNAHSRFIVRPHLFEYVMVVLLLGYLLTTKRSRGPRFFVVPVLMQLLWVNLHASFYLGVALVALFYAGEWLSGRLPGPWHAEGFLDAKTIEWKRVGWVLASMIAVSFVNPSPVEFVFQPLNAEHRELLTAYTLEWRSPFDDAMKGAPFHPYYELLLLLSAAAFTLSLKRLRLTSLLIVGCFALLSLKAHRFRVEFALVAVPLVLDQLRISPLTGHIRKWLEARGRVWMPYAACIVLAAVLIATARDRITIGSTVSDRFPEAAFDFVRQNDIARRSFHSVGHGSFLLWDLYPERKSFIDGRNVDAGLYREFLACQTTSAGFNATINKYRLDGFVLPSPEQSDGGMRRTHDFLIQSRGWTLVYMDRNAYVYVKRNTVPAAWLDEYAYRLYHPVTFPGLRFSAPQADALRGELERAVAADPRYLRPLVDLARLHAVMGEKEKAVEMIDRALRVNPHDPEARSLKRSLAGR